MLINEKYVSNNVWNRSSFKLKQKRVKNEREMWIRADGAFEPIVDRLLFDAAQAIIRARSFRMSDAQMLDVLRDLLSRHGPASSSSSIEQRLPKPLRQSPPNLLIGRLSA